MKGCINCVGAGNARWISGTLILKFYLVIILSLGFPILLITQGGLVEV